MFRHTSEGVSAQDDTMQPTPYHRKHQRWNEIIKNKVKKSIATNEDEKKKAKKSVK